MMSTWQEVNNQSDVDYLKQIYGGFHDSCITELHYFSGADVGENLSMRFGDSTDRKLSVRFKRQWEPVKIELLFEGMRRMNIAGWQNYYFCEILGCYLKRHNDLIKGLDDSLVVWADDVGFNPKELFDRNILAEPLITYIISEKLRWRFLDD
jgi:hypothetical protein